MIFPAFFALIVGSGMIVQWGISFTRRQIPELETEPLRIAFHLAGEMVTALILLVSGLGILLGWSWVVPLYSIGTGMLLYTAIVSPGYFAQRGQWIWLVIFAIIIILALWSSIVVNTAT
jgi:hypothetical protein